VRNTNIPKNDAVSFAPQNASLTSFLINEDLQGPCMIVSATVDPMTGSLDVTFCCIQLVDSDFINAAAPHSRFLRDRDHSACSQQRTRAEYPG